MTVLMGYHPDLEVFTGFDINKHCYFTTGSPSIQIELSTLYDALQDGLSFNKKSNDEIVIGVRADQFLNYCLNATKLHLYGSENYI